MISTKAENILSASFNCNPNQFLSFFPSGRYPAYFLFGPYLKCIPLSYGAFTDCRAENVALFPQPASKYNVHIL